MRKNNTIEAFFTLVRAGLWSDGNLDIRIDGTTDWQEVYRLATEQSVLGLVLAGLEYSDIKPPKVLLLQWIGEVQIIEQRNKAMNSFIGGMVERMREKGIYTLLVKGQGIAQCYDRPLWRTSGDVDLFLSDDNYEKAKQFLLPLSTGNKPERLYSKELGLNIEPWFVEVHGTLRSGLSTRVDIAIDSVRNLVFNNGSVRTWMNGRTQVFLPGATVDAFFVFVHFLKHFYKGEGANLRQLCDWCRLLWKYRDDIDYSLLETHLRDSGLITEWKVFAALSVCYLGAPIESMPFYEEKNKWIKKARIIMGQLLGKNNGRLHTVLSMIKVFPINTIRFIPGIVFEINSLKIKERVRNYKKA